MIASYMNSCQSIVAQSIIDYSLRNPFIESEENREKLFRELCLSEYGEYPGAYELTAVAMQRPAVTPKKGGKKKD